MWMDPWDDVGKLTLDLTKLNVLWVYPLMNMFHGVYKLSRSRVGRSRCVVWSSKRSNMTTTRASPRNKLKKVIIRSGSILLHHSDLILLGDSLFNCLLCWCYVSWAIGSKWSHGTIPMAIMFRLRALIQ